MATDEFIDTTELRRFAADLRTYGPRVQQRARPIVETSARRVRDRLRAEMEASRHFSPVARAIDFDMFVRPEETAAEIGPKKGRPGSLANIAYFGTSRGGGTVPDPGLALQAEAEAMATALADMASREFPL